MHLPTESTGWYFMNMFPIYTFFDVVKFAFLPTGLKMHINSTLKSYLFANVFLYIGQIVVLKAAYSCSKRITPQ